MSISDADVKRFWTYGYLVVPVVFSLEEINEMRAAFDDVYEGRVAEGRDWPYVPPLVNEERVGIRTALFSWYVNDVIKRYVSDSRIVDIVKRLLDTNAVRLWQDQAIWKPGSDGAMTDYGNIGFHQDYGYWQDSSTTDMVSANIALQDVTIDNGALCLFPCSHTLGLIENANNFFDTDLNSLRESLGNIVPRDEARIELRAGQISFHHCLTIHGSGPNITNEPRLVLAPAYMPDGTYYREEGQDHCPHSEFLGPARRHGQPFEGEFFPLVG